MWLRVPQRAAGERPLLRPHITDGQKVGHLPVEGLLPHFNIDPDEIDMHDQSVLPHIHEYEYAFSMFARIKAAHPQPNLTDRVPGSIERWNTSDEMDHSQKCRPVESVKKRGVFRVALVMRLDDSQVLWPAASKLYSMCDAMHSALGCQQLRLHRSMLEHLRVTVTEPHCLLPCSQCLVYS